MSWEKAFMQGDRGFVMSAEHVDPEVIDVALGAWFAHRNAHRKTITGGIFGPIECNAMEAALRAAEEKRCELARSEGQEYAYRACWNAGRDGIMRTDAMSLDKVKEFRDILEGVPWIERALLGTWEHVL